MRLTIKELYDLLSAIEGDKIGQWGDDRSLRLDKLEGKIKREIAKSREAVA